VEKVHPATWSNWKQIQLPPRPHNFPVWSQFWCRVSTLLRDKWLIVQQIFWKPQCKSIWIISHQIYGLRKISKCLWKCIQDSPLLWHQEVIWYNCRIRRLRFWESVTLKNRKIRKPEKSWKSKTMSNFFLVETLALAIEQSFNIGY